MSSLETVQVLCWVNDRRYGTVQYGTVWYSPVQYGLVRYGTVQCSTVRYGMVRYTIFLKFLKVFKGCGLYSLRILKIH